MVAAVKPLVASVAPGGLLLLLAGQMVFCLREMGQIQSVGRRGNGWLYG